ncbi:hypothetical protein J0910_30450 [Nocardiopsis sp. CNT-189]|uniref:hypothetical protein n=1 Tax=Nocardiopsis oceanisediminis TaxID=2816862 RepID=UPI003B360991
MSLVLSELGKGIAQRWLNMLVLPGALYAAVVAVAWTMPHLRPFAFGELLARIDEWASAVDGAGVSALAVLLGAVLLAAAAAGFAAQTLGAIVERWWLQPDTPLLRRAAQRRIAARRKRWNKASKQYERVLGRAVSALGDAHRTGREHNFEMRRAEVNETYRARERISPEHPQRTCWAGDRISAVAVRVGRAHHVELSQIWPSLWLVLDEGNREQLSAAREALTRAATLTGWAVLYGALVVLWWPMLLVAAAITVTAHVHSQNAADRYASLLEAAVRLHIAELARTLGVEIDGPFTAESGRALSRALRG